jgi:hypothetical protein
MKKKSPSFEMWPVYQYGDHPKGTATLGEIAGKLMQGNPKTKVMRLNNALRSSKTPGPKPVAIVGGRVGGLGFVYNVADMVAWRRAHLACVTSKREGVMLRAVQKSEYAKSRNTKAKVAADQAKTAKARYKRYVKMRQHADGLNAKQGF